MPLPRSRTLAALAAAVALLASGCVPSDGSGPAPATPPSATTAPSSPTAGSSAPGSPAPSSPTPTAGSTAPESAAPSSSAPEASAPRPAETSPAPQDPAPSSSGSAVAALERLEVKGRAPKTGYERSVFGPAWADVDHNGCDTRNDILARDLAEETFKPGTHDCVVLTGVLEDPYTGAEIRFTRGQGTSEAVQIDHVVALSDAWQKGAQQLSDARRRALANDPLNLLAVDGPANNAKSDADAASWLPPQRSFRCEYVARQIAVKTVYTLWVTDGEKDAMERVLDSCPDQQLPAGGAAPEAEEEPAATEEPSAVEDTSPAAGAAGEAEATEAEEEAEAEEAEAAGSDPRFSSCTKAKAAGFGPYVKGEDPEYAWYRDGDGDGVDCE